MNKGFSLVELLVVVAILGVLAAVGTLSYNGYVSKARRSSAENVMQQIALAQTEYYSNVGQYFAPPPNGNVFGPNSASYVQFRRIFFKLDFFLNFFDDFF